MYCVQGGGSGKPMEIEKKAGAYADAQHGKLNYGGSKKGEPYNECEEIGSDSTTFRTA